VKDISIQKIILPGLALTGFRTIQTRFQTIKKILLKKELPQHWTVTTTRIMIINTSKVAWILVKISL